MTARTFNKNKTLKKSFDMEAKAKNFGIVPNLSLKKSKIKIIIIIIITPHRGMNDCEVINNNIVILYKSFKFSI